MTEQDAGAIDSSGGGSSRGAVADWPEGGGPELGHGDEVPRSIVLVDEAAGSGGL